jgi:2-C-methyl-D-erythritol 4-phosphate cytidylyltransferase
VSGAEPANAPERDVAVIIVAAGVGARVGGAELKQFRWVAGKPMLLHSVQTFMARPDVCIVICVLPHSHAGDPPPWLFQCDVERLMVTVGGRERSESVAAGLDDLPPEANVVLVHDAARPLVGERTIERVIRAARTGAGAVPALPVVDTLKRVDDEGRIRETIDRRGLWRAQTPQGFPRAMLERAYAEAARARVTATDDAALCERLGLPVIVVPGDERALKVTEEADFARAEAFFALPEA